MVCAGAWVLASETKQQKRVLCPCGPAVGQVVSDSEGFQRHLAVQRATIVPSPVSPTLHPPPTAR